MNKHNENNLKHGPWEEYWSNGNLAYRGEYINGNRHGPWEGFFFENAKLCYRGYYLNNIEIGFWFYYDNTKFLL